MPRFKISASEWEDSLKGLLREYAETLVLAFLLALSLRFFVVGAYHTGTDTMAPNLLPGDFIFGYKLPYGFRLPFRNDVRVGGQLPPRGAMVVLRCPGKSGEYCLKRVVALPGDVVEIRGKRLWINGQVCNYSLKDKGEKAETWVDLEEICQGNARRIRINAERDGSNLPAQAVPPGMVFLLNDFRDRTGDSRLWGPVAQDLVVSEPLGIWLSLDWEAGGMPNLRWARLFQPLH